MKRTTTALAAAGLALAATAIAAPASAEPSFNDNLLKIIKVSTDSVTVQTSCFSDPPQAVIVFFPDRDIFGGIVPIECDGKQQKVVVPIATTLTAGEKVFTYATVSGDGGEINDWGTFRVHR